jgi:hypothetical protein
VGLVEYPSIIYYTTGIEVCQVIQFGGSPCAITVYAHSAREDFQLLHKRLSRHCFRHLPTQYAFHVVSIVYTVLQFIPRCHPLTCFLVEVEQVSFICDAGVALLGERHYAPACTLFLCLEVATV